MRGAFGPILTTAATLAIAAVVVANPVTTPGADIRIPAVELAAGADGGDGMFDEDFIRAVGPEPAPPTTPFAFLRDVVGTIVADAAELGRDAVLFAFRSGANMVPAPELTAASHPYVSAVPPGQESRPWVGPPGPVAEDIRPVVEQALTAIIADAGTVTDSAAVAAAFLAGAALAGDPGAFLDSLRGIVDAHPWSTPGDSAAAGVPRTPNGYDVARAAFRGNPAPGPVLSDDAPPLTSASDLTAADPSVLGAPGDVDQPRRADLSALRDIEPPDNGETGPASPAEPTSSPGRLSAVVGAAADTTRLRRPALPHPARGPLAAVGRAVTARIDQARDAAR